MIAECVLAVEEVARRHKDAVGTVGQLSVVPGATNVIPGMVVFSIGRSAASLGPPAFEYPVDAPPAAMDPTTSPSIRPQMSPPAAPAAAPPARARRPVRTRGAGGFARWPRNCALAGCACTTARAVPSPKKTLAKRAPPYASTRPVSSAGATLLPVEDLVLVRQRGGLSNIEIDASKSRIGGELNSGL